MRSLVAVTAATTAMIVAFSMTSVAQETDCKQCGTCLSDEDVKTVGAAIQELKEIKESKAEIKLKDDIVIVRDWEDRVYVNGGSSKPLKAELKLGTVDRDLEVQLPVTVYYREKPPDPMFRLRLRAQAGVMVPELMKSFSGTLKDFWDAGAGWDFFHVGSINLSAYTGIRTAGGGLGIDLTKNFGPYVGYSITYRGLNSTALAGVYFSLN